jgi:hypothetical protein
LIFETKLLTRDGGQMMLDIVFAGLIVPLEQSAQAVWRCLDQP